MKRLATFKSQLFITDTRDVRIYSLNPPFLWKKDKVNITVKEVAVSAIKLGGYSEVVCYNLGKSKALKDENYMDITEVDSCDSHAESLKKIGYDIL